MGNNNCNLFSFLLFIYFSVQLLHRFNTWKTMQPAAEPSTAVHDLCCSNVFDRGLLWKKTQNKSLVHSRKLCCMSQELKPDFYKLMLTFRHNLLTFMNFCFCFASFIDSWKLGFYFSWLQLWFDISGSVFCHHGCGDLLPLHPIENLSRIPTLKSSR